MSRARTEAVVVRPSNNMYTAITGAACVAVLFAIILLWLRWNSLVADGGPKLFFGFF